MQNRTYIFKEKQINDFNLPIKDLEIVDNSEILIKINNIIIWVKTIINLRIYIL